MCRRPIHIAARSAAALPHECGEKAAAAVADCIDAEGADRVAAVLMESNAGSNGIVAPDSYWPMLRDLTRERGVLLIADEVMSAFGRCGEWFAWQRHGEQGRPDIMTLAKGLTGRDRATRRGRHERRNRETHREGRCSTVA